MASSASTILRLELMASGENDGTWGTKFNTNLNIIESALTGTTSISTTGGTTTLTNVDYVNDQAKKLCLDVTGALVSNATIVIPNAVKTYKVFNRTSGAYTLSVKTSSGSAIVVTQSTSTEVYCDGADVVRFITPMTDFTTGAPATSSGAAASAVSVTPTGDLTSSNAQAALVELQGDIDTIEANLLANYIGNLSKTKGNIPIGTGSAWAALGVGTDGYAMIAKAGATNGVAWAALMPAGESILFYKNTAPTGWTLVTTLDDGAVRIVSGSGAGGGTGGATGGTANFTTAFSARTIAIANLPAHTHTFSGTTTSGGAHVHSIAGSASGETNDASGAANYLMARSTANNGPLSLNQTVIQSNGAHTHPYSGTTSSIGSGTPMNFAVKYASFVRCTKDAY